MQLCDFGIAMWADDAAAQVTGDDVAGTFGCAFRSCHLLNPIFVTGHVLCKESANECGDLLAWQVPCSGVLHARQGEREDGRVRVRRRPPGAHLREEAGERRRGQGQLQGEPRDVGQLRHTRRKHHGPRRPDEAADDGRRRRCGRADDPRCCPVHPASTPTPAEHEQRNI